MGYHNDQRSHSFRRLQIPLKPALAGTEPVAGHTLGTLEGVGAPPPFQCTPGHGSDGGIRSPLRRVLGDLNDDPTVQSPRP